MAEDPEAPESTPEDEVVDAEPPADDADEVVDAAAEAVDADDTTDAVDAAGATDANAVPAVVRKKVVSKRVTPKGGPQSAKGAATGPRTKASSKVADDEGGYSKRYTPPTHQYAAGPSPWWVPTLMFGFLIIGALVIMLNYSGVFGEPQNIRLVIGLGFILAGIVTATQYR